VYDSEDTGILPLTADGEAPNLEGILVGAAAEPDAPWSGAAAKLPTTEQPDRRLLDPEEDSEENEAEVARYAPQEPSRFRWVRRGAILIVVVAVLGGLAYAGQQWTKTQYYVGVENDQVAIYQGLDQQIVGLSLSSVYEVLDVPVEALPTFDRTAIEDSISADSLDDARSIAGRLAVRAEACERFRSQAGGGSDPDDDEPTTEPATSPPSTSARGSTSPATSSPEPTDETTGPGGSSPDATTSDEETSPETSEATSEPAEPDFDDPVTREECGVGGS
jgi:protein phosphatase